MFITRFSYVRELLVGLRVTDTAEPLDAALSVAESIIRSNPPDLSKENERKEKVKVKKQEGKENENGRERETEKGRGKLSQMSDVSE